uniref:Uncharacterized protein n=1 Tax=viral metagenome TaxID=1070528 RepID=A0A6M3KWR3_9ZZZZ
MDKRFGIIEVMEVENGQVVIYTRFEDMAQPMIVFGRMQDFNICLEAMNAFKAKRDIPDVFESAWEN